jgi:lipoprotein LprG
MRRTLLAAVLATVLATSAACSGDDSADTPSGPALPDGTTLLTESAAEMRKVTSATFDISTEGEIASLPLKSARGGITSTGDATGSANLDQAGVPLELTFVIKDDTLYINGLTGGWQKLPLAAAAAVYDPSAILDPDRGVANVLSKATGTTEARESVDGVDAYRVKAKLDGAAVAALVPGVTADVDGTVWVGVDRKLAHRITFTPPGQTGTVTIAFADFDEPVAVEPPALNGP